MQIIKVKPTSPGRRNKTRLINKTIYKGRPLNSLCVFLKRKNGRNNTGRITVRHKSLGCKKKYRILDFYRYKENISGTVKRIEYDPNRNANIALINYDDGENKYIISSKNLNIGDKVISSYDASIKEGNYLPLKNIPCGTKIHCLEIVPRKGAQLIRSAGSYGILVSKKSYFANVILKSGELRKININCRAAIGEVGNEKYNLIKWGKAGMSRLKGIRPTVRGVAMNPIDHPHGGGEGKTSGGRDPVSPSGNSCKGLKTRKKKNIFILKNRLKKVI